MIAVANNSVVVINNLTSRRASVITRRTNSEALIDEVIFNKVNGISNAGYEHKKITDDFPLKRHIICSECGGYLTQTLICATRNTLAAI